MAEMEAVIKKLMCMRCGHTWIPNSESLPHVCPLCHSPYWSKPRSRRSSKGPVVRLRKDTAKLANKTISRSMFGVSPDMPKFERDEDDFRG